MLRGLLGLSLLAAVAYSSPLVAGAVHRTQSTKIITLYEGVVTKANAEKFLQLISDSTDKIIGLKMSIESGNTEDYSYYAASNDGHFTISAGNPMDGSSELLVNGPVGTTTAGAFYTVDGFYLIKSGGSHAAGAISYGAMPVDEASIKLNPRVVIIHKQF